MLELNHINKTYKSKKGKTTKALKDISINFESRGLTFILGTSGSGKSTLLNLIGGLDKCDNGEIKFLNKNISCLSTKELDSYRNKYVGFIFQEFNLLDEYDVYNNIILPLRLQKKAVDQEKVNHILKVLQIENLKTRNINELSGGQKQRIAIARALVKEPMIILADEPTGNLDDDTGTQVMDLLKNISKKCLVIVVSHNKSMAFKYADRILQINNGVIIDDKQLSYQNTEIDSKRKFNIGKTKLPFFDGFKLGIHSIISKKLKFSFTLLLIIFSLLLFGIARTISSFDYSKSYADLLFNNDEEYLYLKKGNTEEYENYLSDNELKKIAKEFKNYNVIQVNTNEYGEKLTYKSIGIDFPNIDGKDSPLYYTLSSSDELNLAVIDSNSIDFDVIGRFPKSDNELAISNYVADHIIKYGIVINGEKQEFKSYNDILNKNININIFEHNLKVVGIVNYDLSKYNFYKDKTYEDLNDSESKIIDSINQTLIYKKDYLYNNLYVTKDFMDNVFTKRARGMITISGNLVNVNFSPLENEIYIYNGISKEKLTSLEKDEMILNINNLMETSFNDSFINYANNSNSSDIEKLKLDFVNDILEKNKIIGSQLNIDLFKENSDEVVTTLKNIKIVGVYIPNVEENNNYLQSDIINDYVSSTIKTSKVILKFNSKEDASKIISKYTFVNAEDNDIVAKTPYSFSIENSIDSLFLVKNVTQVLSIILLAFSILLIFNFISSSLTQKEKTIGTLRAIGASQSDIIKIFMWEGIILSVLAIIITIILLIPSLYLLNINFYTNLRFELNVLFLNYRQIIELVLLMFMITIISSLMPIRKISKMKPIDAINMK